MRTHTAAALLLLMFGGAAAPARPASAQGGALYNGSEALPLPSQDRGDPGYDRDSRYDSRQDESQRRLTVRVWLENDRDQFYPGGQTRVMVRATEDAYVAVVNITPDGDVQFLWPRDYYDDGFLEGDRTYAVNGRSGGYLRVGYGYGIGYVFAIASDEPLDLRRVRDYYFRRGTAWDASLNVVGDPFHAMERLARLLVPDYDDGYGFLDWYSYNVGSTRYAFPRYACYDSYGSWYGSRSAYWDGCDRVRVLLREVPYYYDTRYYRGDRGRYWGRYYPADYRARREPEHRYKESGYDGARGVRTTRPAMRDVPQPGRGGSGDDAQEPRSGAAQQPSRQRPTLQRRPPESEPVRVSQPRAEPQQRRAEPRDEPRSEPRSTSPRSEPRSERRESPPPSREPQSSGSSGSSGPRTSPSSGSSPRVRPNP
jgi:hypothetical protein